VPAVSDDWFDDDIEMDELAYTGAKVSNAKTSVDKVDQMTMKQSPKAKAIEAVPSPPEFVKPKPPQSVIKSISQPDMSVDDSPVIIRPRRPAKRIIAHDDDTSSPDKALAQNRAARIVRRVIPTAGASFPATQPRGPGKLVRATESDDSVQIINNDESVEILTEQPRKRKRPKKLPGDACPFFDLRAINSDDPDSETDSEEGGDPETYV